MKSFLLFNNFGRDGKPCSKPNSRSNCPSNSRNWYEATWESLNSRSFSLFYWGGPHVAEKCVMCLALGPFCVTYRPRIKLC